MNNRGLIQILVWLVILALVIYCCWIVIGLLQLPAAVKTIVLIIFSIVFLLMVLNKFGLMNGDNP